MIRCDKNMNSSSITARGAMRQKHKSTLLSHLSRRDDKNMLSRFCHDRQKTTPLKGGTTSFVTAKPTVSDGYTTGGLKSRPPAECPIHPETKTAKATMQQKVRHNNMDEYTRELIAAEQGVNLAETYSSDLDDYAGTVGEFAEQGIEFANKPDAIEFFLPMQIPTMTHQEKRYAYQGGKIVAYDKPEVLAIRAAFEAKLAKHAPTQPLTGPVRLVTKWCFTLKPKHQNGEWKTSRPDCSNLIKLFEDCMTSTGFWKDDAQVASNVIEKFWAEIPGIYVRVEVMG